MKRFKLSAPNLQVQILSTAPQDSSRAKLRLGDLLNNALPRGLAMFLGGFALLNLLGEFRLAGFDANLWWVDMRVFPQMFSNGFLLLSAACLIAYALRSP